MHVGVDPETQHSRLVWKKLDDATRVRDGDRSRQGRRRSMSCATTARRSRTSSATSTGRSSRAALGAEQARARRRHEADDPGDAAVDARACRETRADGRRAVRARAQSSKKQIVFLEPIEARGAVLEKWMDVRALEDDARRPAGRRAARKDMLAAYIAGDEAKIARAQRCRARRLQEARPDRRRSTTSRWTICCSPQRVMDARASRSCTRAAAGSSPSGRCTSSASAAFSICSREGLQGHPPYAVDRKKRLFNSVRASTLRAGGIHAPSCSCFVFSWLVARARGQQRPRRQSVRRWPAAHRRQVLADVGTRQRRPRHRGHAVHLDAARQRRPRSKCTRCTTCCRRARTT